MDNNIKKYLTGLIKESQVSDVKEMAAYRPDDKRDDKGKITKAKGLWRDDNPTPKGQKGIPDAWLLNPTKEEGKGKIIIPLVCTEEQEFIEKNREWLDSLGVLYQLEMNFVPCKKPWADEPRSYKTGTPYTPSGAKYSAQEWNNRIIKEIVSENFEDEEFINILNSRSIPAVVARDRKNVSQYGNFENDSIQYATHNNNAYETAEQFQDVVKSRILGTEQPEFKTFAMARQYNVGYANWKADKKLDKRYEGKTEKYFLDAYGLEQANLDILLRADFEIRGEKIGDNSFSWNVRLSTKFAKKLPDENSSRLRGSLLDDKLFQATTTAQLDPNKVFDNDNPIMKDINVVNALIQAIDDLKSQIEAVSPKDILKKAIVKQYQVSAQNPNLNESLKNKLVNRIVKKINKK